MVGGLPNKVFRRALARYFFLTHTLRKQETLNQFWFNIGLPSSTLAHHKTTSVQRLVFARNVVDSFNTVLDFYFRRQTCEWLSIAESYKYFSDNSDKFEDRLKKGSRQPFYFDAVEKIL